MVNIHKIWLLKQDKIAVFCNFQISILEFLHHRQNLSSIIYLIYQIGSCRTGDLSVWSMPVLPGSLCVAVSSYSPKASVFRSIGDSKIASRCEGESEWRVYPVKD